MNRLAAILTLAAVSLAAADNIESAKALYNRADYAGALKVLSASKPGDAGTWALMGKSYFMLGEFKKASEAFEKAVQANPRSSEYHHWLGKAYGRRAETASIFTAPGLAGKTRDEFETAVELDPNNLEAINDLFEYYLEAPGLLGGGLDKASDLTARIAKLDPVEYHWAQAQLAEKQKKFGAAEEQLRRAAELAPRQVGRVLDLAKFLARRGKYRESDAAFERAESLAPGSPKVMFERASTYIRTKRNLEVARELLKQYLESPLTPSDPARHEAERLLRQTSGG